jgi:hypothetical protein
MVAYQAEHFAGFTVLQPPPAKFGVGHAFFGLALGEDPARLIVSDAAGPVVFQCLQLVKPADEEQIGDLFDDFQRVRNAARPERVPELIDFITEFAGEYCVVSPPRNSLSDP